VAGCHHEEVTGSQGDLASLTHVACLLADALGFSAVALARAPTTAEIVAQLPSKPWNPYVFSEEDLKSRIGRQVATVEC